MNPSDWSNPGIYKKHLGAQTIMEGIDKCTPLKLSPYIHTLSPQKNLKKKRYPKAKTHVKKTAVHSGENNNLVIQSHMDQLWKGKELSRSTTSRNLTDRKEVYEDNINHLIIRHTWINEITFIPIRLSVFLKTFVMK